MSGLTINIRPEVTILSILQHLNYRPWFALAEFVDNSLASFLKNDEAIRIADGGRTILRVSIDIEVEGPGRIIIRDNAAGISLDDFPRAFRPAELPNDRSGLSEFGMGMKSAACWFARSWSVRTKALGEDVERSVKFNIDEIVADKLETMPVFYRKANPAEHYTEVVLEELHHPPKGAALRRIKDHLASIYRVFLAKSELELLFKGDPLLFQPPDVMVAPYYRHPSAPSTVWSKPIELDFGRGQRVTGFAALRAIASTPYAGFALFRRDRLIEGSADETYRPIQIFGNSNSYRYQRLFGELHLEGFEVSHTKDGFRWEEYEDEFLELLKEELVREPLNLLDQAEGHRSRITKKSIAAKAIAATDSVADVVESEVPPVIDEQEADTQDRGPLPQNSRPPSNELRSRTVELDCAKQKWEVTIRTNIDASQGDWLRIAKKDEHSNESGQTIRCLTIDVALAHPFVTEFVGANNENIEVILRMATGVALSLVMAEDSTGTSPTFALHYLNALLRDALSRP